MSYDVQIRRRVFARSRSTQQLRFAPIRSHSSHSSTLVLMEMKPPSAVAGFLMRAESASRVIWLLHPTQITLFAATVAAAEHGDFAC